MPRDPKPGSATLETPQPSDPVPETRASEVPQPKDAEDDPFDEGNFPV